MGALHCFYLRTPKTLVTPLSGDGRRKIDSNSRKSADGQRPAPLFSSTLTDGAQAAKQAWSLGLCEFHRERALTETAANCSTSLNVRWPAGLAFEFTGVLINYVVWSTDFTDRHRRLELYAKSLVKSVIIVTSE